MPAPAGLRAAVVGMHGEFLLVSWKLSPPRFSPALTPAEREVVHLALAGLSNLQIARRRATAVRTVANQMASALSKLGVRSRLELYAMAARGARVRPAGGER